MILRKPYTQYEGKWLLNLPPFEGNGNKNAILYLVKFLGTVDSQPSAYPYFEYVIIPEGHDGRFLRRFALSGEMESYTPTEADIHNVVTSIFERERSSTT